jgi:hypothetical protein
METSMLSGIDSERIRRDIASASVECSELKRALRRAWARPMGDEQRRLLRVARRVTELCVLLARARGRWHVTTPPREVRDAGVAWDRDAWHARIAERVALDYAPGGEAPGVAAP